MNRENRPSGNSNNKNHKNIPQKNSRRKKKAAYKLAGILLTVIIVIALSVFLSDRLVSAHDNADSHSSDRPKYYKSIQIKAGDTLWQIAEQNMSNEYDSITDYILEVKRINNLASDNIQSSQYLMIPYYSM